MEKQRVLELFSGIGGFSIGLELTTGFKTVAFCENEDFPRKVLKKNWPQVPIYGDITSTRFKENVDLVTAGFPCQDISLAGEGTGLSGQRSGLFWYILRAACMVGRPRLLLENVAALLNRGLSTVLGALASFGYDTEWHCIPASRVGAQHIRDRIWIIADSNCERELQQEGPKQKERGRLGDSFAKDNPDTNNTRLQGREQTRAKREDVGIVEARYRFAFDTENGISRQYWDHKPVLGRGLHGVQDRPHRIKALGNAVVPQIVEVIGRAILEADIIKPELFNETNQGATPCR